MIGSLAEDVSDQTLSQSLHVHSEALVKLEPSVVIGSLAEDVSDQTLSQSSHVHSEALVQSGHAW